MAVSYSHKFGQIIGDSLEMAVEPFLSSFSSENKLYLDRKGHRSIRQGVKLSWLDINGNTHDLDFVIERDGSDTKQGIPAAFIECAWRRYTKHSRNKAQEIQGAIIPLREKYKKFNPFIGVVLAGVFTQNSLEQLRSLGFHILYLPYEKICSAFEAIGIDANFDEQTSEEEFKNKVDKWEALSETEREKLYECISNENLESISYFLGELKAKIDRTISSIKIWSIYGKLYEFNNLEKAKQFLLEEKNINDKTSFLRYESEIIYCNGDSIKVSFQNSIEFLGFLSQFV
ncbi:DNA methylase [Treponema vincentii]|uniref:hypothetical protein n=1 Tax=Treponema vincentii TaxID=69710 RepID=UPI003D8F4C8B